MKAAVIVFPGSNCDRDMRVALEGCGATVDMVWHADSSLGSYDVVVVPGGFSYGDYLRSGAMAAHSPIMREVKAFAQRGGYVFGVCNGFQILTEAGLLPGMLMRNKHLKFICRDVHLTVANADTAFTSNYQKNQAVRIPIAHHDGNFQADPAILADMKEHEQIAFYYSDADGVVSEDVNPNGSIENIAGVFNKNKNVLGMMPHPERLWENALGGIDGRGLIEGLVSLG